MLQFRRRLKPLAAVAVLAVALTACGSGDDEASTDTPQTQPEDTDDTDDGSSDDRQSASGPNTGAAELRATLTAGLQEHVYLAGIAVVQGVKNGLDSPQFEAAAGALDENSVALSEAIGSVYGQEAQDAFLPLWRKHIQFFVDYTAAKASGDQAAAEQAQSDLDSYRTDFAAFISNANPNLPSEAVTEELVPHVNTLIAAIDSVVAGDGEAFDKLKEAAAVMPGTAETLAGGIVQQFPDKFSGDPADGGASLRATLTAGLQEHVYLAGIAIATGLTAGLDSDQFEAAAGALDQNSQDLAAAIGSVYGEEAGDAFLPLWRNHIGFFVDYAKAKANGDQAAADEARNKLDSYRTDFAAFISNANPNLPSEAVTEELVPHVDTVLSVIDSAAAGEGDVFTNLREAAAVMPGTAGTLAGGIAQQFPDQFG